MKTPDTYFISYARDDVNIARRIEKDLNTNGIATWRDEKKLQVGDNWVNDIAEIVTNCKGIILIITRSSKDSHFVNLEVNYAISQKKDIFPLIFEKTEMTGGMQMVVNTFQSINFQDAKDQSSLQKLKDSIRNHTSGNSPIPIAKFYAEDAAQLMQEMSLKLVWKAMSITGSGFWMKLLVIVISGHFTTKFYWISMFLFMVLLGIIMYPFIPDWQAVPLWFTLLYILIISIAFSSLSAIAYYLFHKRILLPYLKKYMTRMFIKDYGLPHRPPDTAPNEVINQLDQLEPILFSILEEPQEKWSEYINRSCPDPKLSYHVHLVLWVLMQL